MDAIVSLWHQLLHVANDPVARLVLGLISLLSFAFSLWALRRTLPILLAHERNMKAEQARFIESQWSRIDFLVATNDEAAKFAAEMFGMNNAGEARKASFYSLYLNLLMGVQSAHDTNMINDEDYNDHFQTFFGNFSGNPDYLKQLIHSGAMSQSFRKEAERRLAARHVKT